MLNCELMDRIFAYITLYIAENGTLPSYRRIAYHFGLRSTATVQAYVHRMIDLEMLDGDTAQQR